MEHKCLKINLLIACLFGLIQCKFSKNNSSSKHFILTFYYNTVFVTIISFYILHLLHTPNAAKMTIKTEALNDKIALILNIIGFALMELWNLSYVSALVSLRINFLSLFRLLKKLNSFNTLKLRSKTKEYSSVIYCFGLKLYFIFTFALQELGETEYGKHYFLDFSMLYIANLNLMSVVDTFFSFIQSILIIMDPLEKKILILKKMKEKMTSEETHSTHKDNINWQSIRKHIFKLKDFLEDLYNFFQLIISFIFLCNFIFTVSFVTKVATEPSKLTTGEFLYRSMGLVYVLFVILIADLPQRKGEKIAHFLYDVASKEDKPELKQKILGLCKVLETFPKISCFGFFTIGRHCLVPILSNLVTYVIIGFQFQLSTEPTSSTCDENEVLEDSK